MSLIKCPECGKEISDRAPSCIHCGYPLSELYPKKQDVICSCCGFSNTLSSDYCEQCGMRLTPYPHPEKPVSPTQQHEVTNSYGMFGSELYCPRCGSAKLSHHYETIGYTTKGYEETHKKSIITRTGNSLGRAGMILATGGLWALTPKKSKYRTTQTSTTQARRIRILDCNSCGYSWRQ